MYTAAHAELLRPWSRQAGDPIADRSQVRWGESVRKGRSATCSTSREPVSSPRRRKSRMHLRSKTAQVLLTLAVVLLATGTAAALATHRRRQRAGHDPARRHGLLGRRAPDAASPPGSVRASTDTRPRAGRR